jgi:hypothetical protein
MVAGCQVGMLLQVGWLLGAAWVVNLALGSKDKGNGRRKVVRSIADVARWGLAGLFSAAVLWVPAIVDARNMAVPELIAGPLDWRRNFLPDGSELGVLLTASALSLIGVAVIVLMRGGGVNRGAFAAAIAIGVAFSTSLSAPLWHLPKMEILQFPWRFLGPTTLVAVLAIGSLRGRWRVVSVTLLLLPLMLLPIRIGAVTDRVPTSSTPKELAVIANQQWDVGPALPSEAGFYSSGFHRIDSLEHLARQAALVEPVDRHAGGGSWRLEMSTSGSVLLPIQWWPEWRITGDGRDLAYANRWGLVAVDLEVGTFEVSASMNRSGSRTLGALLSMAGFAALMLLTRWKRDRRPISTPGIVG